MIDKYIHVMYNTDNNKHNKEDKAMAHFNFSDGSNPYVTLNNRATKNAIRRFRRRGWKVEKADTSHGVDFYNVTIVEKARYILTCSTDGIDIYYEEIIISDKEPGFWECYEIAENHGCEFWTLEKIA